MPQAATRSSPLAAAGAGAEFRLGVLLVAAAAVIWSFGGAIARFIAEPDPWAVVFWRALFAALFLVAFMLVRDGWRGTAALFAGMGLPGLGVATCFGTASTAFVMALQYTTVANILLIQSAAPLFAALLAWLIFRERISVPTWAAIAAVICGVGVMVSGSFSGHVSPVGDGLALIITVLFATAIVITRHAPQVRMTPAVCLGTAASALLSSQLAASLAVSLADLGWLFLFGAVNLGLGLAVFVTGVRLVPAALAALVSTMEPVLGPLWAWLIHSELPPGRTLAGGAIVVAALLIHLVNEWRGQRALRSLG